MGRSSASFFPFVLRKLIRLTSRLGPCINEVRKAVGTKSFIYRYVVSSNLSQKLFVFTMLQLCYSEGTGFTTEAAGELSLEIMKFIYRQHAGWPCVVGKCVSVTWLSGRVVVVVVVGGGGGGGGGGGSCSGSSSSSSSSSIFVVGGGGGRSSSSCTCFCCWWWW